MLQVYMGFGTWYVYGTVIWTRLQFKLNKLTIFLMIIMIGVFVSACRVSVYIPVSVSQVDGLYVEKWRGSLFILFCTGQRRSIKPIHTSPYRHK